MGKALTQMACMSERLTPRLITACWMFVIRAPVSLRACDALPAMLSTVTIITTRVGVAEALPSPTTVISPDRWVPDGSSIVSSGMDWGMA
jgi:hypothetical protein